MSSNQPDQSEGFVSASPIRLISILIILLAIVIILALPFVLRAGQEVVLPLIAAAVFATALAPLYDWLLRRSVPNGLAAALSVLTLLAIMTLAIALVAIPAMGLFESLPTLAKQVSRRLEQVSRSFREFSSMFDALVQVGGQRGVREVVLKGPSMLEEVAFATPRVVLEAIMTLLLTFFMLAGRERLKRRLLLGRRDLGGSVRAAWVFRDTEERLGTYFITTLMVAGGVGVLVAAAAWALGWNSPVMWGGIAAVLNLVPYVGPLTMVVLVAIFGLATESELTRALLPSAGYLAMHAIESNLITPMILGVRLSISPVAVLGSIILFTWTWGLPGAFLAVPILLIFVVLCEHIGSPNLIGFMFGEPLFLSLPEFPEDQPA